jgi:hypothetical protein
MRSLAAVGLTILLVSNARAEAIAPTRLHHEAAAKVGQVRDHMLKRLELSRLPAQVQWDVRQRLQAIHLDSPNGNFPHYQNSATIRGVSNEAVLGFEERIGARQTSHLVHMSDGPQGLVIHSEQKVREGEGPSATLSTSRYTIEHDFTGAIQQLRSSRLSQAGVEGYTEKSEQHRLDPKTGEVIKRIEYREVDTRGER